MLSEFNVHNLALNKTVRTADKDSTSKNNKEYPKPTAILKRNNWSADETKHFIDICASYKVFQRKDLKPTRNSGLYDALQNSMIQKNYSRTQSQIYNKIKTFKDDLDYLRELEGETLAEGFRKKNYFKHLHEAIIGNNGSTISSELESHTSQGAVQDTAQNFENDSAYWTNQERTDLLTLCIDNGYFDFKDSKSIKNYQIKQLIHRKLGNLSHKKSYVQMANQMIYLYNKFETITKTLKKSGEAGLPYVLDKYPYWPLLSELFGSRPKAKTNGLDSIDDVAVVLNDSIRQDEETKTYLAKKNEFVFGILASVRYSPLKTNLRLSKMSLGTNSPMCCFLFC